MISLALEERIRQLLEEGKLSQRKIARTTGISRSTVSAIANGRRATSLAQAVEDGAEHFSLAQEPRRCPECGGMVYMPCHLCRVRAYAARKRTPPGRVPSRTCGPDRLAGHFATAAVSRVDVASGNNVPPVAPVRSASSMPTTCCPPAKRSLTSS